MYNTDDLLRTIERGLEQINDLAGGLDTQDTATLEQMAGIRENTEEVARAVRNLRESIVELEFQAEQTTAKR